MITLKLVSFSYINKETNWKLNQLEFDALTLLVGASGVGKTKILKALTSLKDLALGETTSQIDNLSFSITFEELGVLYLWEGETESSHSLDIAGFDALNENSPSFGFTFEKLSIIHPNLDQETLFNRSRTDLIFSNGKSAPKIALNKSCIGVFSEEDTIKPVYTAFKKIVLFDFEAGRHIVFNSKIIPDFKKLVPEPDSEFYNELLAYLKKQNAPIALKLLIASFVFKDIVNKIKTEFNHVFDFITDVRFHLEDSPNQEDSYVLQIHEDGVGWISSYDMSSGMLKTLLFLSLRYLEPEDSIILVDEFENSLGINCIDLFDFGSNRSSQYILTSHHPYIINKIPMHHWKIVSREAGTVIVKNASDYNLGKSRHDAFKQLINLAAYSEGRD
ncbi:ATP-binding protein [Paenibacillus algorifonticola]|uniref:ATP-binding protein n=1 Tax=Paenibacillus algorifonticola TaxID=684063 RepID=UPI003D2C58B1